MLGVIGSSELVDRSVAAVVARVTGVFRGGFRGRVYVHVCFLLSSLPLMMYCSSRWSFHCGKRDFLPPPAKPKPHIPS